MNNQMPDTLVGHSISETKMRNRNEADMNDLSQRLRESEGEPEICKHFGCGRHLSPQEKLFGKHCIHHIKQNK